MGPFQRILAQNVKRLAAATLLILWSAGAAWSQADHTNDPASLIGTSLRDLIAIFGVPQSVYAARGSDLWQDDVVFAYEDWEFYVYKDRVWQISLKAAYGIKVGEKRDVIPLILGPQVQIYDAHTLYAYPNRSWPISIRFNTDRNGLVSAIFIFRADM
jgi:hypothetical protein